jgi:uncharacterized protein (UPF0332 family)
LVQTLLFDAEEAFEWAKESLVEKRYKDAAYHAYNASVRAAKAILTKGSAKINSHVSIIEAFDAQFPEFKTENGIGFKEAVLRIQKEKPSKPFSKSYLEQSNQLILWIKNKCNDEI